MTADAGAKHPDATEALRAAHADLAQHRWAAALENLKVADEEGILERHDLDAYGEAAWWTGKLTIAIRARERAFSAHIRAEDPAGAAAAALAVASDYGHRLQNALATGWVRRAERLLQQVPDSPVHAYLARARLNQAVSRGDLDRALAEAEKVLEIGLRIADRDIEALGLQDKGRVLVARGAVEEGLALLDEAVVVAISGELSPMATAVVYCNATVACQEVADYRRALEFSDAARDWCSRQSISGFPGMCRVRRAEVTRLRGAWEEAEREARQACTELEDFSLDYAGEGFYQIGEIRLRMGDFEAADDAFRKAHEMGRSPVPGLAMLRLAQNKPSAATALLKRALGDPSVGKIGRARLLAASVEVSLATSDRADAETAARELEAIAEQFGTHAFLATSAMANGALALASADAETAVRTLERARRIWQETDAPYEVARARMLLGEAHQVGGDADAAAFEFRAAEAAFDRLGARPDAEKAREAMRTLSAPAAGKVATATMMFTDIVRSTQLIGAVGDEAWLGLVDWHDRILRALIARHHGEEIDHAGDGFFIAFPDATDAIDCALDIQRKLAEHRREHGYAPSIRIGLHVGPAVRVANGYKGHAVHVAARIGALADGDEILASLDVLEAADGGYAHTPPRDVELRGVSGLVKVARILLEAP